MSLTGTPRGSFEGLVDVGTDAPPPAPPLPGASAAAGPAMNSAPPDVLSDRFPVSSAAVPFSDALRAMVGAGTYPAVDRLWQPPRSSFWEGFDTGSRDSSRPGSGVGSHSGSLASLDLASVTPPDAGNGAGVAVRVPPPLSPKRVFPVDGFTFAPSIPPPTTG